MNIFTILEFRWKRGQNSITTQVKVKQQKKLNFTLSFKLNEKAGRP